MQLDHEKFEGAKEVAAIGVAIAQGRAALATLKTDEDSYLKEREEEAIGRVFKALESVKDLITEIGIYQDELVGYRKEIDGFVDDIRSLIEDMGHYKAFLNDSTSALRSDLDNRQKKMDAAIVEIRKGRALLEADGRDIQAQRKLLGEDRKKIRDDWAAVERASKEIKSKK